MPKQIASTMEEDKGGPPVNGSDDSPTALTSGILQLLRANPPALLHLTSGPPLIPLRSFAFIHLPQEGSTSLLFLLPPEYMRHRFLNGG